jgi:hypothetical protein
LNLGQLKTHVTNRTGNDAISNVLTEFVIQIQNDMCSRHLFSWRKSLPISLTAIANQNYLNPSAYFPNFGDPLDGYELSTPQKLIYIDNWDIGLLDPDYFKATPSRTGRPTHYSVDWENQRLWLYPTPNAATSLRFRYYKNPGEVSNTSASLFIPSKYHFVLAAGVESLVWQLDEDLNSAKAANDRYEAGILRMIDEENNLPDKQSSFTPPQEFVDYSDPFLEF